MISAVPTALDADALRETASGLRAWFCTGACQSLTGAFVAWVDFVTGRFAYDYAEITGYALTYLAHQGNLEHELAVGHRAAEWLADRVHAGLLAAREGWDSDAVYLFDLGMIASGLLSFGRRTESERYVRAGRQLVDFLGEEVRSASIRPVSPRGPASSRSNWSTNGIAHLAKLVQAFMLAGRPEPAAVVVENVMALQLADGRMLTDPESSTTMLHPHMYAAEGLWMWGTAQQDEEALDRARTAVDWAWTHQLETGGLPRSVTGGRPDVIEQCDLTAQAARLALALGKRPSGLDRALTRLAEAAHECRGMLALPYHPGSREIHLNTWATMFGAQTLALAASPGATLRWDELV
jgi:hypothetical protein